MTLASIIRALLARGLRAVADKLDPLIDGLRDDERALIEARRLLHVFMLRVELARLRLARDGDQQ